MTLLLVIYTEISNIS